MRNKFFDQQALMWSFLTVLLMASLDAPWWISFFAAFIILWKAAVEKLKIWRLPKKLTALISLLLAALVYLQFRTLLGQEPSNTLLIGLSALKIMDYENDRDHKILVLLGFLLVSLKSIFSIDFYWLIPSLLVFSGLWFSLLSPRLVFRKTYLARTFAYSVPVALILFIAFPRIVVPWALSRGQSSAGGIGFSDQINPGSIAELAGTDIMAFRVRFLNSRQNARALYWRGAVLNVSEGLRWKHLRPRLAVDPLVKILDKRVDNTVRAEKLEAMLDYDVIIEPGSKAYLFTLNYPTKVRSDELPVAGYQFAVYRTAQPISKSLHYQVVSNTALRDLHPPSEDLFQAPVLGKKTDAWVAKIRSQFSTDREKLDVLKVFFSDPAFTYTLRPGTYVGSDLDAFLFERKTGFCEHFAGAYASLARALGMASRVVVGYQGGLYNPYGGFWRISQKDAHAWVEVFAAGTGGIKYWQAVDPTNWVAPLRLSLGASDFFNLSEEQQRLLARNTEWQVSGGIPWQDTLVFWMEDLNYRWSHFLLEFDAQSQREVWAKLSNNLGFFLAVLSLFGLLYFALIKKVFRMRKPRSSLENLVRQLIVWGKHRGVAYEARLSPPEYFVKLSTRFPELEDILSRIAQLYDLEIYAQVVRADDLKLERLVREWKLKSKTAKSPRLET